MSSWFVHIKGVDRHSNERLFSSATEPKPQGLAVEAKNVVQAFRRGLVGHCA
jgi:hypothetical protein